MRTSLRCRAALFHGPSGGFHRAGVTAGGSGPGGPAACATGPPADRLSGWIPRRQLAALAEET